MGENKRTFEDGLEQLDSLIKEMESGKLPLETSVDLFEKSMKLLAELQIQLDKTEKKVQKLTQNAMNKGPAEKTKAKGGDAPPEE